MIQDISLVCAYISSLPLDFIMSDLSCLYKYQVEGFHVNQNLNNDVAKF